MTLAVICPTRGRPEKANELADTVKATAAQPVTLVFCVDLDDDKLPEYQNLLLDRPDVILETGPRIRLGPTIDKYTVEYAQDHDVVGFLGDDHRPRTQAWDQGVQFALHGVAYGICYGNDLIQGEALPTAVFFTRSIPLALGRVTPPGALHLFLDNYWLALGRELGRIAYLPKIVIEHEHPIGGKVPWDEGYVEVNSDATWKRDEDAFNAHGRAGIRADADTVRRWVSRG